MNKLKYIIYLLCINFIFAGSNDASWINDWLMPNTGLTLWTIVTFLFLLVVLKWKAWGPLMDTLDTREKQIEASLSKAEKVSAQAEEQALKNEEVLNSARKEAQEIISQAKDAGEKLKNKLLDDGKAQCEADIEKAKEQIEREKEKVIAELKEQVSNLSILAAEKIIKKSLNDDDHNNIIKETINEYGQS